MMRAFIQRLRRWWAIRKSARLISICTGIKRKQCRTLLGDTLDTHAMTNAESIAVGEKVSSLWQRTGYDTEKLLRMVSMLQDMSPDITFDGAIALFSSAANHGWRRDVLTSEHIEAYEKMKEMKT